VEGVNQSNLYVLCLLLCNLTVYGFIERDLHPPPLAWRPILPVVCKGGLGGCLANCTDTTLDAMSYQKSDSQLGPDVLISSGA